MSDVRQAARKHAHELNRHRESFKTVAVVQQQTKQQIGEVRQVLKDVTGRTSNELYGPLRDNTQKPAIALATQIETAITDAPPRLTSDSASSDCQARCSTSCSALDAVKSVRNSTSHVRVTVQNTSGSAYGSVTSAQANCDPATKRATRQKQRAAIALACLVFIANSTAVITNAVSLCTHPTCLMLAKLYGILSGSLAITWFCYEHIQKVRRDRKEAEDLKEPISEVLPLETSLWSDIV